MKNNTLSFLRRYWPILVGLGVFLLLTRSDVLFGTFGAMIYGPALTWLAGLSTLVFIHFKFPNTLDADNHDGTFVNAWKALTGKERIDRGLAVFLGLFIGACMIFSALIK